MVRFGLKDYLNMYKHRGIKLPFLYFFENHWFDIKRGVDTHKWLPKDEFLVKSENLENGVLYMCSWESVVKGSFDFVCSYLGLSIEKYTFIDIGIGKGKVLIIWNELLKKYNLKNKIVGIDYCDYLVHIAKNNFNKLFNEQPNILISDVLDVDIKNFGTDFIFYLYNPFDDVIMKKFIDKLENMNVILIYNNPQFTHLLLDNGFNILTEQNHWHYNGNYVILERRNEKRILK